MPLGGLLPYGDEEETSAPSAPPQLTPEILEQLLAHLTAPGQNAQFQSGAGLDNPFPNVNSLTDPSGARLDMLGTPPGGPVGPPPPPARFTPPGMEGQLAPDIDQEGGAAIRELLQWVASQKGRR